MPVKWCEGMAIPFGVLPFLEARSRALFASISRGCRLWARLRPLAAPLAALAAVLLFGRAAQAHEPWVLTPDEIAICLAKPAPALFTTLSATNVTMVLLFLLFIIGWVRLGYTGARELFPDLQARLSSYGDYVAPILRFCLAWMLLSAAFGTEPRVGVPVFAQPTLFVPELQLRLLDPMWGWLRWAEAIIGLALLVGIYVRIFALLLILLGLLGIWLFGLSALLPYIGAIAGTAIYLAMQGPGRYFLPLPAGPWLHRSQAWLAAQPRQRAQAIMRVLTGASILYAGVAFKVLHPNLMIGIIEIYNVPLLSSAPAAFTLLMALVEVSAGLLMIAGILLRPLSLVFLFAFLFFATLLPEGYMAHAVFYGVMISFLFNAAGHWGMPEARDKAAEIVIVGSGIAAITAAMRIEKLIGPYTRVRITLVSDSPNMLFYPLLPEVLSGGMQPGSVVNPIRRIVPQTRVLTGRLDRVDCAARQIVVHRKNCSRLMLRYDQLILALFLEPNVDLVPGMMSQASTIDSVGDALHIRKRILDLVQDAELAQDPAERSRLLTFAIVGSGQRACATAIEICELLRTVEVSYPVLRGRSWQVYLYEDAKAPFTDFEAKIQSRRDGEMEGAGVRLCREDRIVALAERSIVLASGERREVGMVVNASFHWPVVYLGDRHVHWPPQTRADLRLTEYEDIWSPGIKMPRHFLTSAELADLGRTVGHNAWARSQDYRARPYQRRAHLLQPYNMGRHSFCGVAGLILSGIPGWMLSRLSNLHVLPGLERNLRILIDWLLDIPFRYDIAALEPDQSERLYRRHFSAGDEVISEGEMGDTAYVVDSGRLAVFRGGEKVAELGEGDCFGEIALLGNSKRTATIRCLTDCELVVLARDDLHTLTTGRGALAQAIRRQAEDRLQHSSAAQ